MKYSILLLTALIGFISCKNDHVEPNNSTCNDSVVISTQKYDTTQTDDFTFGSVQIEGDCLKITAIIGGGCGEISFQLLASAFVIETLPEKREIRLVVEDKDICKALLYEELSYDLTSLRTGRTGTIYFLLQGYDGPLKYTY